MDSARKRGYSTGCSREPSGPFVTNALVFAMPEAELAANPFSPHQVEGDRVVYGPDLFTRLACAE